MDTVGEFENSKGTPGKTEGPLAVQVKVLPREYPFGEVEPYGDCLGHAKSHLDYWTENQVLGDLSSDTEYEEHPRGQIVYSSKTGRYSLCADGCILPMLFATTSCVWGQYDNGSKKQKTSASSIQFTFFRWMPERQAPVAAFIIRS